MDKIIIELEDDHETDEYVEELEKLLDGEPEEDIFSDLEEELGEEEPFSETEVMEDELSLGDLEEPTSEEDDLLSELSELDELVQEDDDYELELEELEKELSLDLEEELDEELGLEIEEEPDPDTELGLEIEEEVTFECPVCGQEVEEEHTTCPSCEAVFEEDDVLEELSILEEALKEEEEPKLSEEQQEVMDIIDEIERFCTDLKSKDMDIGVVNKLKAEMKEKMYGDDIESAYRLGLEAISLCENMERFLNRAGKLKSELELFREKGWNYEPYFKELESAKKSVESGFTKRGMEVLDEMLEKVQKKKDSYRDLHKKKEEINEVVTGLNSILNSAKRLKMPLAEERELISNALVASKTGDVQKALNWLLDAREQALDKIETRISDDISHLEERVHEIDDQNLEDMLMKARDAKIDADYSLAADYITRARRGVQDRSGESDGEMAKFKDLIDAAESIGVDCTGVKGYYERAVREENRERKKVYLESGKKALTKRLPPMLQRAMKEGLIKLEEAKSEGQNISKPVTYLKQANLNVKKKDYIKALEYINVFNRSITKEEKKPKKAEYVRQKKVIREEKEPTKQVRVNKKTTLPHRLNKASTYLIAEKNPNTAFRMFKKELNKGMSGVCVTRQYPVKVKSKYNLEDIRILWLSNIDQKDAFKPKNLEKLSLEIEKILSRGSGLVLLDGVEYLISNNDFRTVFHLIQSIKDQVAVTGSILIITVTPSTLEEHQMDLLEKEVDETYVI